MAEIDFSPAGILKIDAFFAKHFRGNLVTSKKDRERFYAYLFFKVIQSETKYYELDSSESISGCPVILDFSPDDFLMEV